jgi:hypothetical protein
MRLEKFTRFLNITIIIIIIYLLISVSHVYSQIQILIYPEADATVSESSLSSSVPQNAFSKVLLQTGLKGGQILSYLRFDLSSIPQSNPFNQVQIDSAELKLLASSAHGKVSKFLVTIDYCPENSWSEENITWKDRVCSHKLQSVDSILINGTDLPRVYLWNLESG